MKNWIQYEAGRLAVVLSPYVTYQELLEFATEWERGASGLLTERTAKRQIKEAMLKKVAEIPNLRKMLNQKKEIIEKAVRNLKGMGRDTTLLEICSYLGISEDKYFAWRYEEEIGKLLKFAPTFQKSSSFSKENVMEKLERAFSFLSKEQKMVIDLFFYEDLTLFEMSEVLDMSCEEITSLYAIAVGKLKEHIGDYIVLFSL